MEFIEKNGLYVPDYLDKKTAKIKEDQGLIQEFYELYELQRMIGIDTLIVGDMDSPKCRFCLKSYPETTFSDNHHLIPELLSQNETRTYYECDECEKKYFVLQDDHLGNFLGGLRSFDRIKGKDGIVNYDSPHSDMKIRPDGNTVNLHNMDGSQYDPITGIMPVVLTKPGYRPAMVYQSLVRIGYQLLDEDEIPSFESTRRWLLEKEKDTNRMKLTLPFFFSRLLKNKYHYLTALLYKRKNINVMEAVPEKILIVHTAIYQFQVMLPYAASDTRKSYRGIDKKYRVPRLPPMFDKEYSHEQRPDMSSFDLIQNEVQKLDIVPEPGTKPTITPRRP